VSVGVVVDKSIAKKHGTTPEERLDSIIESEPILKKAGMGRKRVSEVMAYTNYQLISERAHGPGWIAVGDSFGFVDPMLSPGLFMAMHMAEILDRKVFKAGSGVLLNPQKLATQFSKIEAEMRDWHAAWSEVIEYFYDGRMFSMYEGGSKLKETYQKWAFPTMMEKHLSANITRMVSGVSTRSRYGRKLIHFTSKHLIWDTEPPEYYAVKAGLVPADFS
jgi:flavin-dependent dehydrogenase